MTPRDGTATGRFRILAIANETVGCDALHSLIVNQAGDGDTEVLVVAPALNSRLRHWMSDEDGARRAAETRLAACRGRRGRGGGVACGWVGDADPLRAIDDALRAFPASEMVIATH